MTMTTVKLKDLTPSKNNPRTAFSEDALAGLAASIKVDGLLQNLVVRKRGNKYEIISGERRFRALKLLQERSDITGTFPVNVDVREDVDANDALRIATVENVQREQLAPLDEADAFVRMVGKGDNLADIAAKAGVSEATVKRRLALANLGKEARKRLASGSISLSVAEALTLGTAAQQRQLLKNGHVGMDAAYVRRCLVREKMPVSAAIFPIEQYSGSLTRDMFSTDEETFFDDVEQFQALQAAAVDREAENFRQSDAAFVEVLTDAHVSWWQYEKAKKGKPAGVVIHHSPSGEVEIRTGLACLLVKEEVKAAVAPKPRPEYCPALPTGSRCSLGQRR